MRVVNLLTYLTLLSIFGKKTFDSIKSKQQIWNLFPRLFSSKLYINNKLHNKNFFSLSDLVFYLISENGQCPFRFVKNIDSFWGGEQPYESTQSWLMFATQRVPFVGCILTIFKILENGPSLKYIPTSNKDKNESFCCILKIGCFIFQTVFTNKIKEGHHLLLLN